MSDITDPMHTTGLQWINGTPGYQDNCYVGRYVGRDPLIVSRLVFAHPLGYSAYDQDSITQEETK